MAVKGDMVEKYLRWRMQFDTSEADDSLSKWVAGVRKTAGGHGMILGALAGSAAGAGEGAYKGAAGEMLSLATGLKSVLGMVGKPALAATGAASAVGGPLGMVLGVAAGVLSTALSAFGAVFISPIKAMFSGFMAAFSVTTAIMSVIRPVLELLSTMMQYVMLPFQEVAMQVFQAMMPFFREVGKHVERLAATLGPLLAKIVGALAPVLEKILDILMPVVDIVLRVVGGVLVAILEGINKVVEYLTPENASKATALGLRAGAGAIGGGIVGAIFGMPVLGAAIGAVAVPLLGKLYDKVGKMATEHFGPVIGKIMQLAMPGGPIFGILELVQKLLPDAEEGPPQPASFLGLSGKESWQAHVKQWEGRGVMGGPAVAGAGALGLAPQPGAFGPQMGQGEFPEAAPEGSFLKTIVDIRGYMGDFVSLAKEIAFEIRRRAEIEGGRDTADGHNIGLERSLRGAGVSGGGGGRPGYIEYLGQGG